MVGPTRWRWLVATNVLGSDRFSNRELVQTYTEHHRVERGVAFLKDPRFLDSSVLLTELEHIVALSLVMVLCALVYRLAEHRLREQVAATRETVPNQLNQPTDCPTLRWTFQCFEGVSLARLLVAHGPPQLEITGVESHQRHVLRILRFSYAKRYELAT